MRNGQSDAEQTADLKRQAAAFLNSEHLLKLYELLKTDSQHFSSDYDQRNSTAGRVKEAQEIKEQRNLETMRPQLCAIFEALGLFDVTEPERGDGNQHIIVPGASLNSCFLRTEKAASSLTDRTKSFTGLSCYRPISPKERNGAWKSCPAETEFGAMTSAFHQFLNLPLKDPEDAFCGDRNLNRISCIRRLKTGRDGFECAIFAAPSTEPELRRADTADTFRFWLEHMKLEEGDTLLVITDNAYCNRQFLQFAYYLLKEERPVGLDVVGCHVLEPSDREHLRISFFLQEVIALKNWCEKIIEAFPERR